MRGIALHRVDQIGDQVMPLAQLGVDIGPTLPDILPQPDEPIVNQDRNQA